MNGIRERLPAGAVAFAGVLVCAPAAFLATQGSTGADGELIPRVTRWSWGRVALEAAGKTEVYLENVASRVLMLVLLALALTGVVVWLVRPRLWQLALAVFGLTLLLGRQVAAMVSRHGESSPMAEQGPGPSFDLLPAGVLELAGLALLLGGLVLIVRQAVRDGTTSAARPEPRPRRHLAGPAVGFVDEA